MSQRKKSLAAAFGTLAITVLMPATSLAREKYTPPDFSWTYQVLKPTDVLKRDAKGHAIAKRDDKNHIVRDRRGRIVYETETKLLPYSTRENPPIQTADYTDDGEARRAVMVTIPKEAVGDVTIWSLRPGNNFFAAADRTIRFNGGDARAIIINDGDQDHPLTLLVMNGDSTCTIKTNGVELRNEKGDTANFTAPDPTNYNPAGQSYSIVRIKRDCPPPPALGG